ncbi:MAG: hypothetical protein JWM95_2882 [Gemmatimonadetes bacterium]|nr:hypothetical protein [Gemmatimonadota bacterium]
MAGPDGKAIAGAMVEVTSVETEVTRRKTTNDQGKYTLQSAPTASPDSACALRDDNCASG